MDIFAKLYASQFAATPYTQVDVILGARLDIDISTSSATIELPDYVSGIRQYHFIELIRVGSTDEILFRGFVEDIVPEPGKITLDCKGEKYILKFKRSTADYIASGQTIQTVLNQLFTNWNASFGDALSLSSYPSYTLPTKQIKMGDNMFDIIEELATANGMVWDCYKGATRIVSLLGGDYTSGSTVKELLFDNDDPTQNTIAKIKPQLLSSSSSVLFATDGTNRVIKSDAGAIASYGAISSDVVQIRKTDASGLNTDAQAQLDKVKNPQWAYHIEVDPTVFECELGSKVLVTIANTNEYMDFDGIGIVNGKEMDLENGSFKTKYVVSDKYLQKRGFYERFKNIEKNLELRILQ